MADMHLGELKTTFMESTFPKVRKQLCASCFTVFYTEHKGNLVCNECRKENSEWLRRNSKTKQKK